MAKNEWVDVPLQSQDDGWEDVPLSGAASSSGGEITKTQSFARGAVQGASLGFADELVGGLGAVSRKLAGAMGGADAGKTLGQLYAEERDDSRQNFKAAEQANPWTYRGGQVAGSVATSAIPGGGTFGLGKAAASVIGGAGKAASVGRAVTAMGVNAAAQGAVEAAGSSEGKSAGEVLSDAGKGGAVGGGIGGAFGAAGKLLPGVRGSVTNDLWRKVLGVTVGEDAAETATKYLKDPEARNAIVRLATKDTVDKVKEAVTAQIADDVARVRGEAASRGAALLASVDDRMAEKVDDVRSLVGRIYKPGAENMGGATGRNLQSLMKEVDQILSGENVAVLGMVGDEVGERLVNAPNAQVLRDVRDSIKKQLFRQGDPGQGVRDGLSNTEAKAMRSLLAKVQNSFKSIPEAAKADSMYSAAADYASEVERRLFKNGAPSSSAIESWVLGKGAAGAVEDKDNVFALRDIAMKELGKSDAFGKGAIAQTRAMQEFNRLGGGERTGLATGPLTAFFGASLMADIQSGGLASALVVAAQQPRLYLRALAKAEDLTTEDRRLLMALLRAARLEATKKATEE